MIGETVGSYRLIDLLGAGGMGEVYSAEHLYLERRAAIKLLQLPLSSDEEAIDRFFSEARATSLIHHPGIVDIYDCAVHESGRAYLVMDLLDGETLARRLAREGGFATNVRPALDIAREIASALGAAHGRGIVHRDLKPENVFLARAPGGFQVKVLDFGIAKLIRREAGGKAEEGTARPSHTRTDRLLGTPAYMSPEQCRDAHLVDHRADIYALGCILFEMIAGRPPFLGEGHGPLLAAHLWQQPADLRRLVPGVGVSVASLVDRMLAKEPDQRPATMATVEREIVSVVESLGEPTAEIAAIAAAPAPASASARFSHDTDRVRWLLGRTLTGRRSVVGLAALGWLAAGVVIAVRVLARDRRPVAPVSARAEVLGPAAPTVTEPRDVSAEIEGAARDPGAMVGRRAGEVPVAPPAAQNPVVPREASTSVAGAAPRSPASEKPKAVPVRPVRAGPRRAWPAPHPVLDLSEEERKL